MALSANPTPSDVSEAIRTNANYHINGSLTECKDYIEAVTWRLAQPRHGARGGGEEYDFDLKVLAQLLKRAETWYAMRASSGGRRVYGTGKSRDAHSF